jgi:hypothetical protein
MSFLHPLLLWLLPLAVIPILLHLLTLHRLKTVELSTYRFLFDSYVQQRRRMQFLEALLAMLRTLFLLVLIFLICRPIVKHWNQLFRTGSGREVILLVDCSASMKAQTGGVAALERAKRAALALVDHLGPDDRLTLVRVTARAEEVFSRFARDAGPLREKIEGLKASPARANFYTALEQVLGSETTRRGKPLVYVFTDCQASGWREVRDQGLERQLPPGGQLLIVNVGSQETAGNLAVLGDAPRRNHVIAGLPLELQPRVVNYSRSENADATVRIIVDEKEITRLRLTLQPGETAMRKVIFVPAEPGNLRGRFEVSAPNADRFPDDNRFLFTLAVAPRVKVLLVNGNPSPDPLENEGLYLRTALTVSREEVEKKMAALAGGKEAVRALDVQEITEDRINPESLQDASVVILSDCGRLGGQQFEWLRNFVSSGGGLLVFPGERVNSDQYNREFFTVPGPQEVHLTAATLKPPEGDPNRAETFEQLGVVDFAHPVLSVFDDPEAHYLKSAYFGRRFPILMPRKPEQTWPLAEFARGGPALVESRFGDGLVLLGAFPANAKWTNLPLKPEFVPLILRLVGYAQRRPVLEVPSVVQPDAVAEVSVAKTWNAASGKVTDEAGRSSPLTFERSASRLIGAFERTGEHGYYTVEVAGDSSKQKQQGTAVFAVNLAPEESDVEVLGENQFRELLPGAPLTWIDATAEAQQLFGAVGNEREMWRPLIFLLFAIIGVEFTLATLDGSNREGEGSVTVAQRLRRLGPGRWVARMTGAR